jgi:hypothetical protein
MGDKRTGGCACGAIRYAVTGDPQLQVACHCRDCQYATGGGTSYGMIFERRAVTFTGAEPTVYSSPAASGRRVHRAFCAICGTQVYAAGDGNPSRLVLRPGTLDDPSGFTAQGHLWTASAPPWHVIPPDLPHWDRNPDWTA